MRILARAAFLSFLLIWSFAVTASSDDATPSNCEIFYEVYPHRDTAAIIGESLYAGLSRIDREEWKSLSLLESSQLGTILAASKGIADRITIRGIRITQGGYQGVSSISINVPIKLTEKTDSNDIISFASMIGYIYYQDSVLVSCDRQTGPANSPAFFYSITDQGEKDYINPVTSRLIFGMMMGYLNEVESVGYTYDEHRGVFRVLEFDRKNTPKRNALSSITMHLSDLSDGRVKLDITTSEVYALFSRNRWKTHPGGGKYIERFAGDINMEMLQGRRKSFKKALWSYINMDQ